jgi:hypothetical protein
MTMLNENHCLVHGFVVWDGVSRAETLDDGGKKFSVKIAVDPNDPQAIQELHNLEQQQINSGQFKGNLPAGAHRAIGQVSGNEKLSEWFNGYYIINAVTYQAPQIVDANSGQDMQPMAWGPKLYTGARIGVIVSPREYNNKQKGVGWWLSGIGIYPNDQSPQLNIGGGGYDARQAFGGGGQQAPQGQQGYGNQAPQQAPQQQQYGGQPQQQQQAPQGQQNFQQPQGNGYGPQ